jgi:hypothetical protein
VCLVHNCLLADACSTCGKYQRRQQVYRRVPTPTMCVCGDLLGAAETVKLPTDHVIVDAQPQVLDVINEGECPSEYSWPPEVPYATYWLPPGAWPIVF